MVTPPPVAWKNAPNVTRTFPARFFPFVWHRRAKFSNVNDTAAQGFSHMDEIAAQDSPQPLFYNSILWGRGLVCSVFFCHHFFLSDAIDFCILCIFSKVFYGPSMLYHSRLCREMLVDHHSLVSLYLFRLQTSLLPPPFILESFHSFRTFREDGRFMSICPFSSFRALSFDTFQETGSSIFWQNIPVLYHSILWRGEALSIFLAKFLSTCIHSSLRGLVSIYLFKGLFCLLIHSKPVRKNYSTIFSLLSEVADLFLIISWKSIFHCHSISSPTSFMGVTLPTYILANALLPSFIPLFLPSPIFLRIIEIIFYFAKMAKQLKQGGSVVFALFYPHSFLSEVIHVHIFFRSLFYHPSSLYHTFLVRRMLLGASFIPLWRGPCLPPSKYGTIGHWRMIEERMQRCKDVEKHAPQRYQDDKGQVWNETSNPKKNGMKAPWRMVEETFEKI